jgi:hypothetical protein
LAACCGARRYDRIAGLAEQRRQRGGQGPADRDRNFYSRQSGGPGSRIARVSKADFTSTQGRIVSPAAGALVPDCEYFTGTAAKLPSGQTLILSQHNLGGDDPLRYIQVIYGFQKPENLTTWRTAQYFNPAAVGQHMLIELIELPLTQDLVKADNDQRYDLTSALAAKGKVLAAVTVVHVKKHNPAWPCPGPA